MAQGHMDRLSAIDPSFLTNESSSAHMHVGGVMIFEGPPPATRTCSSISARAFTWSRAFARSSRIRRSRRADRSGSTTPPSTSSTTCVTRRCPRPVPRNSCATSPHASSPSSSTARSRSGSYGWSRASPASASRSSRRRITRSSTASPASTSQRSSSTSSRCPSPSGPTTIGCPLRTPSSAQLAAKGAQGLAKIPLALSRRAERAASHPQRPLDRVGELTAAVGEVAWNFANPAPDAAAQRSRSARTGASSGCSRPRAVQADQGRARRHRQRRRARRGRQAACATGCTPAAFAPRDWRFARRCRFRSGPPDEQGAARQQDHGDAGRRCPSTSTIPVQRLRRYASRCGTSRIRRQALGAEVISRFNDFAPPTLLAQAARINFSTRLFNLVVTNVPGPQVPIYLLGRELEDMLPGRLPAAGPGALRRDHVLQRRGQLRPACRLRLDGRRRDHRRRHRAGDRRAAPSRRSCAREANEQPSSAEGLTNGGGPFRYHLELTPEQLKIVHTALRSLLDDFGHDEPRDHRSDPFGVVQAAGRARDPGDPDRRGRRPAPVVDITPPDRGTEPDPGVA